MSVWLVSSSVQRIELDGQGRGEITFTVVNSGPAPEQAVFDVNPGPGADRSRFEIFGPSRLVVIPGAAVDFEVACTFPAGTAAGRYTVQGVAYSAGRPDTMALSNPVELLAGYLVPAGAPFTAGTAAGSTQVLPAVPAVPALLEGNGAAGSGTTPGGNAAMSGGPIPGGPISGLAATRPHGSWPGPTTSTDPGTTPGGTPANGGLGTASGGPGPGGMPAPTGPLGLPGGVAGPGMPGGGAGPGLPGGQTAPGKPAGLKPKRRGRLLIAAAAALVVLLAIGAAGFFFLRGNDDQGEAAPPPPPPPAAVVVPDVTLLPQEQAIAILEVSNLTVGEVVAVQQRNRQDGTVFDQSIRQGRTVEPGTAIDLAVVDNDP